MRVSVALVLLLVFVVPSPTNAQVRIDDVEKFQEYNPDGQKFEFTKGFLKSLQYFYKNDQKRKKLPEINSETIESEQRILVLQNYVNNANFNLRIARNNLRRERYADNGLMIKAIDLFEKTCDAQIALNNEERIIFTEINQAINDDTVKMLDKKGLIEKLQTIGYSRKDSSQMLLEASLLVNKVLISSESDQYGDLTKLGVTSYQRQNLLDQLNNISNNSWEWGLSSGQTFIEGSLSTIREMLEDYSWQSYDG